MPDGRSQPDRYRCCIVGGGPAGMMLGFLLARAGLDVVVLEKHEDFFRDFRGDTVHPSTLQLFHELGLLQELLRVPHQEAQRLTGMVGTAEVPVADFSHLPTVCRFIAFMPQWDFLDFVAGQARRYSGFHLRMGADVTDLIIEQDRVAGVRGRGPDGPFEIRADLVVGADGRHSTVREGAGFAVADLGAPMDVTWMRLSRKPGDREQPLGRFEPGQIFIMINRGDYFQCGFVIPKGGLDALHREGLDAFRARIAQAAPFVRDRVGELASWDDIKLLTVSVDRLRQWCRPGLLCIGDAAHAMSPVGGVGINLAIQDAVAAANILAGPLGRGVPSIERLRAVQRRRTFPTRMTQRLQVVIQNRVVSRTLAATGPVAVPWFFRLFRWFPILGRLPARAIGIGFRPEHIRTPDVHRRPPGRRDAGAAGSA